MSTLVTWPSRRPASLAYCRPYPLVRTVDLGQLVSATRTAAAGSVQALAGRKARPLVAATSRLIDDWVALVIPQLDVQLASLADPDDLPEPDLRDFWHELQRRPGAATMTPGARIAVWGPTARASVLALLDVVFDQTEIKISLSPTSWVDLTLERLDRARFRRDTAVSLEDQPSVLGVSANAFFDGALVDASGVNLAYRDRLTTLSCDGEHLHVHQRCALLLEVEGSPVVVAADSTLARGQELLDDVRATMAATFRVRPGSALARLYPEWVDGADERRGVGGLVFRGGGAAPIDDSFSELDEAAWLLDAEAVQDLVI